MKINYQDVINNPGKYDAGYSKEVASQNPDSVIYQGLYGGGLNAGGTNDFYKLQGYQVPGATNGIGPDGSVLFMADPGNGRGQEWLNENFGPGGRYYGGARTSATAATPGTATTTQGTTAAPSRMSLKDADTLGQALRVAGGGNGNITNKELMQIGKQFDVGSDKVVRRLDTVNSNRLKNRKAAIGLGSNAYNKLTSRGLMDNMFANYGDGYLGQAITSGMSKMVGGGSGDGASSAMSDPLRVRKGLTVTGLSAKGDVDTREKFLLKGMFNRPQAKAATPEVTATQTTNTGTGTSSPTAGPGGAVGMAVEGASQAAEALGPGGLYGGGAGAGGASRLRRARSRQQQLGIRGAGTSINNRTSPFFNSLNR
jgi:hypothetical protein